VQYVSAVQLISFSSLYTRVRWDSNAGDVR